MQHISELNDDFINELVRQIDEKEKVDFTLPGEGRLMIEKAVPFLLIHRSDGTDSNPFYKFLYSESCFLIIGTGYEQEYHGLLLQLAEYFSSRFKSYLFLELWEGEPDSYDFVIKGPSQRIPSTIDALRENLVKITSFSPSVNLNCIVEDTEDRHRPDMKDLLSIGELKNSGSLLVGLEVPPVYRDENRNVYPLYFRKFHNKLSEAIHHAIFDFVRVQTSNTTANFSSIGRATIDEAAREVDRELCRIDHSFQFLWLISPSNIHEIKKHFFDSHCKEVLNFHYRLLPVDPDIVKRQLYNLPIENVEDPSLAFLFLQKREELDRKITMLKERGSREFYYNSLRLYGEVSGALLQVAENLLREVSRQEDSEDPDSISAGEFGKLVHEECRMLSGQHDEFNCKVHIRKDVNVMMVSHGELYIPADYEMSARGARALVQHEIGTHALTFFNGSRQPIAQLAYGLADYDSLQEGLAVLSEYLVGGLTKERIQVLAGRVIAGHALQNKADFHEIFRLLTRDYGLSAPLSFNITSRFMQGGGFMKDIIYLKGLVELMEYLRKGGDIEPLYSGKIATRHINLIRNLQERGMINPPEVLPSFLYEPESRNRLDKVRNGLNLVDITYL